MKKNLSGCDVGNLTQHIVSLEHRSPEKESMHDDFFTLSVAIFNFNECLDERIIEFLIEHYDINIIPQGILEMYIMQSKDHNKVLSILQQHNDPVFVLAIAKIMMSFLIMPEHDNDPKKPLFDQLCHLICTLSNKDIDILQTITQCAVNADNIVFDNTLLNIITYNNLDKSLIYEKYENTLPLYNIGGPNVDLWVQFLSNKKDVTQTKTQRVEKVIQADDLSNIIIDANKLYLFLKAGENLSLKKESYERILSTYRYCSLNTKNESLLNDLMNLIAMLYQKYLFEIPHPVCATMIDCVDIKNTETLLYKTIDANQETLHQVITRMISVHIAHENMQISDLHRYLSLGYRDETMISYFCPKLIDENNIRILEDFCVCLSQYGLLSEQKSLGALVFDIIDKVFDTEIDYLQSQETYKSMFASSLQGHLLKFAKREKAMEWIRLYTSKDTSSIPLCLQYYTILADDDTNKVQEFIDSFRDHDKPTYYKLIITHSNILEMDSLLQEKLFYELLRENTKLSLDTAHKVFITSIHGSENDLSQADQEKLEKRIREIELQSIKTGVCERHHHHQLMCKHFIPGSDEYHHYFLLGCLYNGLFERFMSYVIENDLPIREEYKRRFDEKRQNKELKKLEEGKKGMKLVDYRSTHVQRIRNNLSEGKALISCTGCNEQKFIFFESPNGAPVFASNNLKKHADILKFLSSENGWKDRYQCDLMVMGGGYLEIDHFTKQVFLSGSSGTYGRVHPDYHSLMIAVLNKEFPNYEVIIDRTSSWFEPMKE